MNMNNNFDTWDIDIMTACRKQHVTDEIYLTSDDLKTMYQYVFGPLPKTDYTTVGKVLSNMSADIIIADTIPLHDFKIHLKIIDGTTHVGSCHICKNYITNQGPIAPADLQQFLAENKNADIIIGVIVFHNEKLDGTNVTASLPFGIHNDHFAIGTDILHIEMNGMERSIDSLSKGARQIIHEIFVESYFIQYIQIFYIINCMLMNPIIKCVFDKDSRSLVDQSSTNKPSKKIKNPKKKKIRYIKRITINTDHIDKAFEEKGFVRKTMVWYVTGHWREYSTGKRIFIKGHWKGPLRGAKDIADNVSRDREMVI